MGDEPDSKYEHLKHSGHYHRFFPTEVADIFSFDVPGRDSPGAVLDIVKGAFDVGDKYISFYVFDSDMVRFTGYLVKYRESEKYDKGDAVLQNTTQLGAVIYKSSHLAERKVRSGLSWRL